MRAQKILVIVLLAAATALPEAAQAQFSPRGIIGALTHPLRSMLGRFGHFPRGHRPRAEPEAHQASSPSAQFGDVGPSNWPSAFQDVIGFTFWPERYAAQVRAHGFDVVADALTSVGRGPEVARNTTGAAVQSDSDGNAANDCSAPGAQIEWPASQIGEDGKLDDAQRVALGKLQSAVSEATKTIKAGGCRDQRALPPLDRLKATLQKLWAVRDAGIYVRAPLRAFYEQLSDEQKKAFAWKQPAEPVTQPGKADNGAMARQYQTCAAPGHEASERLLRQIEQEVQPRKEQDQAMQDLRNTVSDMTKLTSAPCGKPIEPDPIARLDAANDQLSNLSYAATSMEIALDGLYAQLDDGQKAKFDSLGR
jgi:hypothetical protein